MPSRHHSGPVLLGWEAAPAGRRSDRARAIGDALLLALAHELTGMTPTRVERRCPVCGSDEHGRPVLPDSALSASLSYADGIVVAAVARALEAPAIGVDVERGDADGRPDDLALLFSPRPAPTIDQWSRMEAALKADGRGFTLEPTDVVLTSDEAVVAGEPPLRTAAVDSPAGTVIRIAWQPALSAGAGPDETSDRR